MRDRFHFATAGLGGYLLRLALLFLLFTPSFTMAQEDRIVKVAIETARVHMRIPREMEVRFLEKKRSPLQGFFSVKLLVLAPDREMPVVVYVDEAGEKVILGALIVRGENVSLKEAGEARPRKHDMKQFETGRTAIRGNPNGNVTIVEFSNFKCSYCQLSWTKIETMLEKYPQALRYIFKHFPLRSLQGSMELAEIAASAQFVSDEAFWLVHDFLFSPEGQMIVRENMDTVRKRVEQVLKEKGYDLKEFQSALETGKGKQKVVEDMALGNKIPVLGTPTVLVNGDLISGEFNEQVLERYLRK